mgnify:CR=1 FL=1
MEKPEIVEKKEQEFFPVVKGLKDLILLHRFCEEIKNTPFANIYYDGGDIVLLKELRDAQVIVADEIYHTLYKFTDPISRRACLSVWSDQIERKLKRHKYIPFLRKICRKYIVKIIRANENLVDYRIRHEIAKREGRIREILGYKQIGLVRIVARIMAAFNLFEKRESLDKIISFILKGTKETIDYFLVIHQEIVYDNSNSYGTDVDELDLLPHLLRLYAVLKGKEDTFYQICRKAIDQINRNKNQINYPATAENNLLLSAS